MVGAFADVTLVGAAIALGLAWLAWRSRTNPGARPLLVLTLAIAVWNVAVFAAIVADGIHWSVVWSRVHFVGLTLVAPALFALVVEYGGRDDLLTRRTVAALLVEPIVVNGLLWTSSYHDLFLEYVPTSSPRAADATIAVMGRVGVVPVGLDAVFWLHAVYTWGLVVVSLGLAVHWMVRRRALYRKQFGLVALAIVVPLAASLLDNVGSLSVRLTEPSFVVASTLLTVSVVAFDFVDVTPIAHSTVLDQLQSGVVVLDDEDRIVDLNEAGKRLLTVDESAIGRSLEAVLSDVPDVYDRYVDEWDGTDTITVDTGEGVRHFRIEATPLTDARDATVGRAFLIHDVTDQRERQAELERQNEHLERFASLVSHDLRNPLEVARGNLELARGTDDGDDGDDGDGDDGDDYLETVAESHERMTTIIDDVLTLARQGRRLDDGDRNRVALAPLADAAWQTVDTGMATLDNRLRGTVDADRSRLIRVFENLFRNAIEHGSTSNRSPADDAVSITVGCIGTTDDGALVDLDRKGFYVADDGPGVPPPERESVFETGYTTGTEGTGLGLSIVASVVEAHGWEVRVTESDEGGARFEITGVASL